MDNREILGPHPATVCLIGIFSIWFTCRALWDALKEALFRGVHPEHTQVYSPKELLDYFKKQESRSFWWRLFFAKDKIKAFVEGSVDCDKPIESFTDKDVKLVHRVFYREDVYSNPSFAAPRKDVKIDAPMYFYLKDPVTGNACKVHRATPPELGSVFKEVSVREWRTERNFGSFELALISLGMSYPRLARGIKIGWSEKELGIKMGSTLMVYGEVIYNAVDGKLRIDSPLFYMLKKEDLITYMKDKVNRYDKVILLLLMVGFIIAFDIGIRGISNWVRMRREKLLRKRLMERLLQEQAVKLKDDYRCIKCQRRPRNMIMQPCRDLCLCDECYGEADMKTCPICACEVKGSMKIFLP